MEVFMIKLSSLRPNSNNPRTIKSDRFKQLVKSIKDFPKMMALRPMVVDESGMVLGGNQRFRALQELGYKEVPDEWVKRADELTPDEIRRFIVQDNESFGETNWEMLANEYDEAELMDWGIEVPGVSETAGGDGGNAASDPFDDSGITAKNQYGVIVMCANEAEQEHIFSRLTGEGFNCKIVVT
jgi:hypothetical protein